MKLRRILPLLMVFILSSVTAITVSAAKVGDPYSWYGVQIGFVLIIAAVVIGLILWYAWKTAAFKKALVPLAIVAVAGLLLAITDVAVEVEPAEITPDVDWSVSVVATGGNVSYDNDLNKVTILCHVNDTAGTILNTDDTAFTAPVLNFTIAPTVIAGLTDLTLGATTIGSVINPDVSFVVSGTSYDLFADVTGATGDKDLAWVADGTTEYEWHYCTVQFGDSENAVLTMTYNPAGISQLDVGAIKSTTISIGGETYTVSLIITGELSPN